MSTTSAAPSPRTVSTPAVEAAPTTRAPRRPDPADRRSVPVKLTAQGKEAVDHALERHLANEERLLRPLSPADRSALDELLRRLLAGLEQGV